MGVVIVFRSATYAQKAERVLSRNGIASAIMKVPPQMNRGSCAHGVKVNANRAQQAIALLNEYSLPINSVFTVNQQGQWGNFA